MAVIRNKFDNRIKDVSDIQSFKQYNDKYVDESGYFSDYLCRFQCLKSCHMGTLTSINNNDSAGDYIFVCDDKINYRYFIPESLLKPEEKKYRPYTLPEFVNEYSLGDEIVLRRKEGNRGIEHKLFAEYIEGDEDVCFSGFWYPLNILFNDYELYTDEGWKPFGVIGVDVKG